MKKLILFILLLFLILPVINAQISDKYDLNLGLVAQKTQSLYWENGIGADFSSEALFNKRLHIKAGFISSRLGSSMFSYALNQDNYLLGVDWHFRASKPFQIFVGCNTGLFYVDYNNSAFDVLPNTSMLMAIETGLTYKFQFPVSVNLSAGYNLINGDGISTPGTLFPVFYKFAVFYRIGSHSN